MHLCAFCFGGSEMIWFQREKTNSRIGGYHMFDPKSDSPSSLYVNQALGCCSVWFVFVAQNVVMLLECFSLL